MFTQVLHYSIGSLIMPALTPARPSTSLSYSTTYNRRTTKTAMFQISVIAFAGDMVAFCEGYIGCYHNTSTSPIGYQLFELRRFIKSLQIVKADTKFMTGINAAYQVVDSITSSNHGKHLQGKSVDNNTVL